MPGEGGGRRGVRWTVEVAVVAGAALVLFAAYSMDTAWTDRHFLPDFFREHDVYRAGVTWARVGLVVVALVLLLLVRPWLGRLAQANSLRAMLFAALPYVVAVAAAFGVTEMVLRTPQWHVAAEMPKALEPRLLPDPHLGWTFGPRRVGYHRVGGRDVEWAFDPLGYRVAHPGDRVDLEAPTIVFAGESMMAGHGLTWSESVPAQVQAITGYQGANIAVNGYSFDQAYMRLQGELPRFRQPVAVVSLFAPILFAKHIDVFRPHFTPDMTWRPPEGRTRFEALHDRFVRYRSDRQIEQGLAVDRAIMRATVDAARARGAAALIVVPEFGPEDPASRMIRRRVLDEGGVPYVVVAMDPRLRIPGDGHPTAEGARIIAQAIAERLRLPPQPAPP